MRIGIGMAMGLIVVRGVLAGSPAAAQVAGNTAAPDEAGGLEEIVVSATRREESAQSVPISMTTLSAQDLSVAGVTQTRDLVDLAPNLSEQGSFGRTDPSFFIRGVGSTQFNPNANSKVGVYMDDVYLNSPAVQGAQLYDLDRVEVARGPQGTLFGQNTTAGLVRAISTKPSIGAGWSADVQVTSGNYDALDTEAAVGFDTGESSAARLSLFDQNRSGTMDNTYLHTQDGRTDVLSGRVQWLWAPTEDMQWLFNLHGTRDRSGLTPYKQLGLVDPQTGGACPHPGLGSGCTDPFGYADSTDFHQGEWGVPNQFNWVDALGASAVLDWKLPGFTLASVTAFERNTSRIHEDTSTSPEYYIVGSYFGHPRQISQEIRLTSPQGRLQWIAGLYYFHENLDSSEHFATAGLGPSAFTGSSGDLEGLGQVSSMMTNSYAGFGNLDFSATERLKLSVGLRYTHEVKELSYDAYITDVDSLIPASFVSGSTIAALALAQTIDFPASRAWNNVSGRASIDYTISQNVTTYASIARGFNSGNYNGGAFLDKAEASLVNPETLLSYEVGVKSELGGRLRLNADAFYYEFRNQQVFVLASGAGGVPFEQLSNAAASSLYGGELELDWKPIAPLLAQLGVGYTHSRFDNFNSPLGGNYTGNTLPSAPERNLNALVRYEVPLPVATLGVELDGKYQSHQFFSVDNDPLLAQGGFTTLNARVSLSMLKQRLVVSAWCKNLSAKDYVIAAYDLRSFGFDQWVVGDPRTYGVTVQYRTR